MTADSEEVVASSRQGQGFPPKIDDQVVLARIAALLSTEDEQDEAS